MKTTTIATSALLIATIGMLTQCKKNATGADKILFDKSNITTGFTYYKNDNSILPSSNPSAHNKFFRVRFNDIAQTALTDNGKLPAGGSFPDGSLIVKELFDTQNGELKLLAAMEKAPANSAAGVGWIWGEYTPDGKVVFSIDKKGDGCISCHSTNARDYARLFELFP